MIHPCKICLAALLGVACVLPTTRAEYLFNSFIVPDASFNADRTS